jgi:hypothetical protein
MRIETLDELGAWLTDPIGTGKNHSQTHIADLADEADRVRAALNNDLDAEFSVHMFGQDRSDFAQIEVPQNLLNDVSEKWIEIRLSNTWPLAAITEESAIQKAALEAIKLTLERIGYVPVNQKIFGKFRLQDAERHELWYRLFDFE